MVKISPTFLQRLIDTVCCLAQMYKVELGIASILNKGVGRQRQSISIKTYKLTHLFENVWMFGAHKLSHTKSILREKGDTQYEKDALDASYDSCNLLL